MFLENNDRRTKGWSPAESIAKSDLAGTGLERKLRLHFARYLALASAEGNIFLYKTSESIVEKP